MERVERRSKNRPQLVRGRRGLYLLVVSVAFAAVLGLSLRLYFSPERLRGWIDAAIAHSAAPIAIEIGEVHLHLANGAVPEIAIALERLKIKNMAPCTDDGGVALTVGRLVVPVRWTSLLSGPISFGRLRASDIEADVEQFKKCDRPSSPINSASELPAGAGVATNPHAGTSTLASSLAWWSADDYRQVSAILSGLAIGRLKLNFENRTKFIYIDSLLADLELSPEDVIGGAIRGRARVRIPSSLTAGESLPVLDIVGRIEAARADLSLRTQQSEGTIVGEAHVKPAANRQLSLESRIRATSLPLSTFIPLLTKVAVIKRPMQPRFLWLNCEVRMKGQFQGLFDTSPTTFHDCEIVGNGTKLHFKEATRLPDGRWRPFDGDIQSADIRQFLEMFAINGLDGIASEFGRFTGSFHAAERGAEINGTVGPIKLRFSNRNIHAYQTVTDVKARVRLHDDGSVEGGVTEMKVDGGAFKGSLDFDFAKSARVGSVRLNIQNLRLSKPVSSLLTGGDVEAISGQLTADFASARLATIKGELNLANLDGTFGSAREVRVVPSLKPNGGIGLKLNSPEITFAAGSNFNELFKQILFGRAAFEGRYSIQDLAVDGEVSREGYFGWREATGSLAKHRVRILSHGEFDRERRLDAEIRVDFPKVKKLLWHLEGFAETPRAMLQDSSDGVTADSDFGI